MKKRRFLMPVGLLLIIALASAIVLLLWNLLIPTIFGLATINYWQAMGIFILARILFGGFGMSKMMMGGMFRHHKNPLHEKWTKMTPEQRQKFIETRRKFGMGHPFGREPFDMECHEEHESKNE